MLCFLIFFKLPASNDDWGGEDISQQNSEILNICYGIFVAVIVSIQREQK